MQTDATTPNIVGPAMLEVVASFCTKLKVWTVANFAQQLPITASTGCANGVVGQQCCVCLHGAMVITNKLVLTFSAMLPKLG